MSGATAANPFRQLGKLLKDKAHKPACLYDLVFGLPSNGVGRLVRRSLWTHDDCFVKLTRVDVKAVPRTNLKRGTAYGVLTWRGETDNIERKLTSTCKRDWRVS